MKRAESTVNLGNNWSDGVWDFINYAPLGRGVGSSELPFCDA